VSSTYSPPQSELFALNPDARGDIELIGGQMPVLLIDNIYAHPQEVRRHALSLDYEAAGNFYPGKLAKVDRDNPSLQNFLRSVLDSVNSMYLPRIPPINENNRRISRLSRVHTDFAIADIHPDDLTPAQRMPHTDSVPIFGLVYLNEKERGGTLFFKQPGAEQPADGRQGYYSSDEAGAGFAGKIEGVFNRLAIYPGFVPHSGEMAGDWISSEARFSDPRLTQRLAFLP